jgi:hypothetical protein
MSNHYVCGIDFQHEMDGNFADFYDTIEDLKRDKSRCWQQCGIVELELGDRGEILNHKWIVEQDLEWGK